MTSRLEEKLLHLIVEWVLGIRKEQPGIKCPHTLCHSSVASAYLSTFFLYQCQNFDVNVACQIFRKSVSGVAVNLSGPPVLLWRPQERRVRLGNLWMSSLRSLNSKGHFNVRYFLTCFDSYHRLRQRRRSISDKELTAGGRSVIHRGPKIQG